MGDLTLDLKSIIAIIAVITTITTAYLANWRRNRKSLVYEILTFAPLLTTKEEIKNDLKIFYKDKPVKNVQLLILKLINNGQQPISSKDFEKSLNINLLDEAHILSCEILDRKPENLEINIKLKEDKISILPLLLNSKDFIKIKIIISGEITQIKFDTRIIGVEEIKEINNTRLVFADFLALTSLLFFIFATLILIFSTLTTLDYIIFILSLICSLTIYIVFGTNLTSVRGKFNKL